MVTALQAPDRQFQRTYERILFWAIIFLAEFHMFACSFREVLPGYSDPCFRLERWIGTAILAALLIYFGISAFCYPGTFVKLKALFQKMPSFEQAYMLWVFVWYIVVLTVWQVIKGNDINLFKENDWWLFEQALMSFVFFPLPCIMGSKRAKKLIETMIKLVLIPHMFVWSWILWQYFHMNYIVFPSGGQLTMLPDMSLSFGYNRNITGAGAMIMMALCLYFIATQEKLRKLPYFFGLAVYLAILLLSNCRTSWYSTLLIGILGSFFAVWFGLKGRPWLFRIFLGVILAVGCVIFLHWLRGEIFILLDTSYIRLQDTAAAAETARAYVQTTQVYGPSLLKESVSFCPDFSSAGFSSVPLAVETGTAVDFARTLESDGGGLSGRVPLYKACLDVMFSRKLIFFFGIPSSDFGAAMYGQYGIQTYYNHAHNFLLTMGVYYGVPTMLFTAVFLVLVFVRCFRVLFINKKPIFQGLWMIPVILAALVAEDMMESFLNLSAWSMTCISFYLFAGWIVAMDREQRQRRCIKERMNLKGTFPKRKLSLSK